MPPDARPKLAVFKFSSCDGCQLALLSLEDELLSLAGEVEIAYFLEARSRILPGPYDVALVEGSITTAEDVERIQAVRKDSKFLVTIGACATWEEMGVDFEVNGCPINKNQILEVITALLVGRVPDLPGDSVCMECKRRGTVCVMVARGLPCLGPLTQTGCGAICPAYNRGCYGCFGPTEDLNADSLGARLLKDGMQRGDLVRLLRGFTGFAEAFRSASDKWDKPA